MRHGSFDHIPPAPSREDLLSSVPNMHSYHRDPSMSSIGAHFMPREKVTAPSLLSCIFLFMQ